MEGVAIHWLLKEDVDKDEEEKERRRKTGQALEGNVCGEWGRQHAREGKRSLESAVLSHKVGKSIL